MTIKPNQMFFAMLVAAFAVLSWPQLADAQTAETGALAGIISDSSGATIPGAQIDVANEATGLTSNTISQGNGRYTVALLPPGSYRVEVKESGFKLAVDSAHPRQRGGNHPA